LQSDKSMSFTPGCKTIELIGRFWRAPFHRQQLYVLNKYKKKLDMESKDNLIYTRVCHKDVNTMFSILFIFALGLEHKLLEDIIIACDDTAQTI
jgi:hypothetical protein